MAARRLLIVMVMLLVISTVVALLAPDTTEREEAAERGDEAEEPALRPGWRDASRDAGESVVRRVALADRPRVVRLRIGDHLTLLVSDEKGRQIEIPDLGLLETAAAGSPARFEIYAARRGTFEVLARPVGPGGGQSEPVRPATLVIGAAGAGASRAPGE